METDDSYDDPYYDEVHSPGRARRPPPQRVVYVQQQADENRGRSDSDTIRTYTTSPKAAQAPPLPFGLRPLVDTTKSKTSIRITLYTG